MDACRILIVDDDPLVSMHLETIIARLLRSEVTLSASVAEAEAALAQRIDFALLDVDVLDGTTYAFASRLSDRRIPFAFISASDPEARPPSLRTAPFVAKPYTENDIIDLLETEGACRSSAAS